MATATDPTLLPELTTDDLSRYSRHLILPEVGIEGQRKLKAARVLCVGTGGLGSPLALYLAAAGIGTLGLVDFDVVDASNLQRQIIHSTKDIGRKKLDSAADKLIALNPALNVVKHDTMLSSANALAELRCSKFSGRLYSWSACRDGCIPSSLLRSGSSSIARLIPAWCCVRSCDLVSSPDGGRWRARPTILDASPEHQVGRNGQAVQERPSRSVGWADISGLSNGGRRCPP